MGERTLFNRNQTTNCGHNYELVVCALVSLAEFMYSKPNTTVQSSSHVKMTNDNIYRSWSISWRSPERIRWPRRRKCGALCSIGSRALYHTFYITLLNWLEIGVTKRNEAKKEALKQTHTTRVNTVRKKTWPNKQISQIQWHNIIIIDTNRWNCHCYFIIIKLLILLFSCVCARSARINDCEILYSHIKSNMTHFR